MAPELPDPAFAKIVVLTPDAEAREALKHRLREAVSQGLAPEAYVRVTQLVFGPYTPFPVEFRVMGPDPAQLYEVSENALDIMRGVPDVRQANRDWGNRTPVLRFVPDQDRLNLIGLSPAEVGQQLQFLLTGIPVTQVREDIRNVRNTQSLFDQGLCLIARKWRDFVLQQRQQGWLLPGLAAAVGKTLGLGARETLGLFQLAIAPGVMAHGMEQTHQPISSNPLLRDEQYDCPRD